MTPRAVDDPLGRGLAWPAWPRPRRARDQRKPGIAGGEGWPPYIQAGVPDPGRSGRAKDYQSPSAALRKIRRERMLPMPRLRNDPSGGVFARVRSTGPTSDLWPIAHTDRPARSRPAARPLRHHGHARAVSRPPGPPPAVRARAAGPQRPAPAADPAAVRDLPGTHVEPPRHAAGTTASRLASAKEMSEGLTQQVQGVLALDGENSIYEPADLPATSPTQLPELLPALGPPRPRPLGRGPRQGLSTTPGEVAGWRTPHPRFAETLRAAMSR